MYYPSNYKDLKFVLKTCPKIPMQAEDVVEGPTVPVEVVEGHLAEEIANLVTRRN